MDEKINFNAVFCAMVNGLAAKGHTDPAVIVNEAFKVAEAAMVRVHSAEPLETLADVQKRQFAAEKQAALQAQGKGTTGLQRPAGV